MDNTVTKESCSAEYIAIKTSVFELQSAARKSNHRRVLWLAGDAQWGWHWAEKISQWLKNTPVNASISWVSASAPNFVSQVESKKAAELLGTGYHHLVFNTHDGFDPDVLGIVAGVVRGGGLLIFLTPDIHLWRQSASTSIKSLFFSRLTKIFESAACLHLIKQDQSFHSSTKLLCKTPSFNDPLNGSSFVYTEDQIKAIASIIHVVEGHRRRPLILTSDRGRGKSTALGLAAAKLLLKGVKKIIVTAPRPGAADQLFEQARKQLPEAVCHGHKLKLGIQSIEFVAPDDLIANKHEVSLLMVDEAAAIPVQMLSELVQSYSRIVFSSTIHGYEGTGKGFVTRFHEILHQYAPGWKSLELHKPVRWDEDDPVESMVFEALLLNAEPVDGSIIKKAARERCIFEKLNRIALNSNERDLSELFGLLVLAHYRTRPSDLLTLLDSEKIEIYVARYQGHIIAAVVLCAEGQLDQDTAKAIYNGQRRLPGHLIPQALAAYTGIQDAPVYLWQRIMRIAMHPAVRRQGLAAKLIEFVTDDLKGREVVALGASFGGSVDLVTFWKCCDFTVVRAGITREHSSGARSVLMLKPLTPIGAQLCEQSRQRFQRHYLHLLAEPLSTMAPNLALSLFPSECTVTQARQTALGTKLNEQDWQELQAFAYASRGYEVSAAALYDLVSELFWLGLACTKMLTMQQQHLLMMKVLQKRRWSEISSALGYSGRKEIVDKIRTAVQSILFELNKVSNS